MRTGENRRQVHGPALALVAFGPSETEVHDPRVAIVADHHIVGLEVAVDEPSLVRRCKPAAGFREHPQHLTPRPRLLDFGHPCTEGLARNELHRHEQLILVQAHVVDGDDVSVVEFGERLGLALQPRASARLALGFQQLRATLRSRSGS
jgi:hypothetical protein